jgi:hypothetical protein
MRNVTSQPAPSGTADESEAAHIREALDGQYVCPFCGVVNSAGEGMCPRCSMENTPAARKATKARIGPWYVYQHRNPAAPGMKFETLLTFVRKGKVKARSIVRGPTTGQLWRFAAHVKGVSREFGVCYSCGAAIETTANICPQCNHLQEPPINPDVLLESAENQKPAPAATPVRAASAATHINGPFSSDLSDTELPQIDDLLNDTEQAMPIIGSAPVASFRKPVQQDDFLSARELATAFNLGFTPPSGSRAGRRPRRRGGWAKRISLFLLLIIAGASGGIYLRPQLRQRAMDWASQKWKSLQPVASAKPSKQTDSSAADEADLPKSLREAHRLPKAAPSSLAKPATMPAEQKLPATQPAPTVVTRTQPMPEVVTQRPLVHVDAAPVEKSKVVAQVAPQTQPVVPQKQLPSAPPQDSVALADAGEQARTLYNQGIDAEQHVDFTAAVKSYEKIMKLPREVWPTDLELRLRLARKQAEQK